MKEVISKILIIAGIVAMFAVFIFSGLLLSSDDGNKKLDQYFSEPILP